MILVVGAYVASGRHVTTAPVSAESSEELLKVYATQDTDNDGLADWQEALYGTDPKNPRSVRSTLTDGEAVAQGLATPHYAGQPKEAASEPVDIADSIPGSTAAPDSLTDQFAILFFNNYMASRGDGALSEAQAQTFVQGAIKKLIEAQKPSNQFSSSEMKVSGKGSAALVAYAAQVEQAFAKNTVQLPYDEMTYFSDAVKKDDAVALAHVAEIAEAYRNIALAISTISVPQEAAQAHLAFVNATARLAVTIGDLAALKEDPIRSMLGLGVYPQNLASFAQSLKAMNAVFVAQSVVLTEGDAGYSFYNLTKVATQSP